MTPRMTRESARAKRARIADLLALYYEKNEAAKKIDRELKDLKDQVRQVAPGTYDGWVRSEGTPREVLDQKAVKEDYQRRGVEVPMVPTQPPVVVHPAAESTTKRK